VVARYSWFDRDGHRRTAAQVLTVRDGRVVDIQDYRSPARAAAAARLLAFA
jgi:ketosteroid isomerase-like protein